MESQYHYIIISEDFKIEKHFVVPKIKFRYIIKCEFKRSTAKNEFYKNILFDKCNKRIANNTINIDNISCLISEEEMWDIVKKSNHNGVAIKAKITDILGNSQEKNFENNAHDGSGFKCLFDYISLLVKYSTHVSVDEINILKSKIIKLKQAE